MRIGVLGATTIEGGPALPTRDRRVLAALALDAPNAMSPERLSEALWGDDRPASWKKVLQNSVSRLRRALGQDAIASGPGGYQLEVAKGDIDVSRFEQLMELAERAIETDPADAEGYLEAADSLWRGAAFADLDHWPDAFASTQRLASRKRTLDELRAECLLATGRLDDAVALATALVEAEPLDERRVALLATALYRSGRSVDALGVLRHLRRALREDLGLDPGPPLAALELAVLRHDDSLTRDTGTRARAEPEPPRRRPVDGNLPVPLSSLIGRRADVARVSQLLVDERLVVLTGPGGVGKTRVAVAAGDAVRSTFSGGVWFVDLAGTPRGGDVGALISEAFGFVPGQGRTVEETVIEGIRDRDVLLLLDNCEHVLDGVATFVTETLPRCPGLRLLATSRESLGIDGETVVPVSPLAVETSSTDLFADRAAHAGIVLHPDDRAWVERICRYLDGIPLAIELAAAQARTLPLEELARRLEQRLDELASTRHGRRERHRTMRAALDWSHDLLRPGERMAFRRASVFAAGFDLTAAEHVLGDPDLSADVLHVLGGLVDKSMVVADTRSYAPFRLLEPVRQYAHEQLVASGEAELLARRHAEYYASLSAELSSRMRGPDEIDAGHRLDAARANLRVAFSTAVALADGDLALRIVAPLSEYSNLHVWAEPWQWCDTALELPGAEEHPLRAATLILLSRGYWQQDRHAMALIRAEDALALAEPGSPTWREALIARSTALTFLGRIADAEQAAIEATDPFLDETDARSLHRLAVRVLTTNLAGHPELHLARDLLRSAKVSSPSTHATALHVLSVVGEHEDPALLIEHNERALDLARATGAVLIEGFALGTLAVAESRADPRTGAARYVDVMARYLAVGNGAHLRGFGRGVIGCLVECGAYEAAGMVDGATHHDVALLTRRAEPIKDAIDRARRQLGPSYDVAVRRGELMTDDELVRTLRQVVDALV